MCSTTLVFQNLLLLFHTYPGFSSNLLLFGVQFRQAKMLEFLSNSNSWTYKNYYDFFQYDWNLSSRQEQLQQFEPLPDEWEDPKGGGATQRAPCQHHSGEESSRSPQTKLILHHRKPCRCQKQFFYLYHTHKAAKQRARGGGGHLIKEETEKDIVVLKQVNKLWDF